MILLFTVLMILVFGNVLRIAVKAAWGLAKIVLTLVLLPLALVGMVFWGLLKIALPIVIIVGLVSVLKTE